LYADVVVVVVAVDAVDVVDAVVDSKIWQIPLPRGTYYQALIVMKEKVPHFVVVGM
jgi:hypothetical protein